MIRSEYAANQALQSAPRATSWEKPSTCRRTVPRESRFGLVVVFSLVSAVITCLVG